MTDIFDIWSVGRKAAALVLLTIPGTGFAQVTLPEGCEAFLTVQQKGCLVTHHYTCTGDPAGHQWRVDLDQSGMTYAAQIDREAQWIYSLDLYSGVEDTLVPDPADPASMTELLENQLDTWDFQTKEMTGKITRFRGFDRLTGETVVIDDVPLLTGSAEIEALSADGTTQWSAKGTQYVSPKWRVFFFGPDEFTDAEGEVTTLDHSPVEFIMPGEKGFLSNQPKYECNVELASFPNTPTHEVLK